MSARVGIVGVGVMGTAMGRNLLGAGYVITCCDIRGEQVAGLEAVGAVGRRSAAEVADDSDVVLLSLPSVDALYDVVEGDGGIVGTSNRDVVVVEMGTLPLADKEAVRSTLAKAGMTMLDVPVSGTGLQAADATLVVFASGNEEAFRVAEPVFDVIGKKTHYLGEFGNGSKMKYIANLLVAVHNLATAEAHALGIAAGLDPALVQEVQSDGVGSSKIFDIRGPMMVVDSYDPPAARLDIILKDARIISAFAHAHGAPTPLLSAAIPVYEASVSDGLGDLDAAALCRYLERIGGIDRQP